MYSTNLIVLVHISMLRYYVHLRIAYKNAKLTLLYLITTKFQRFVCPMFHQLFDETRECIKNGV